MKFVDKSFRRFVEEEYEYQSSLCEPDYLLDTEKRAYAVLAKLTEELGELSEATLALFANQSRRKDSKTFSVSDEIADVLICTLMLAQHLGIDPEEAVTNKVERVVHRRTLSKDTNS